MLQFLTVSSQEYFPKNDGVKSENQNYTAFINAEIHTTPDQVIKKGTLLIHNGKVVGSGSGITIPENTVIIDLKGKSVYPSFIDVFSDFGIKLPKASTERSRVPQYDSKREGYYWNEHVMPEKEATAQFNFNDEKAKELLKAGFGVVNTHVQDGIVRGSGLLVALNAHGNDNERILMPKSGQYLSFKKSKYINCVHSSYVISNFNRKYNLNSLSISMMYLSIEIFKID